MLRSFPPPHRLRGKPLKIPKKPRPPTVIPALATHNNHVTARLRQKSWQSATSCHCETFRSWQSIVYTSLRDFRQKIVAIQCMHVSNDRLILSLRGAKRRGNPLTSVHFLDCFASLAMTVFFTLAKTVHKKITPKTNTLHVLHILFV